MTFVFFVDEMSFLGSIQQSLISEKDGYYMGENERDFKPAGQNEESSNTISPDYLLPSPPTAASSLSIQPSGKIRFSVANRWVGTVT